MPMAFAQCVPNIAALVAIRLTAILSGYYPEQQQAPQKSPSLLTVEVSTQRRAFDTLTPNSGLAELS